MNQIAAKHNTDAEIQKKMNFWDKLQYGHQKFKDLKLTKPTREWKETCCRVLFDAKTTSMTSKPLILSFKFAPGQTNASRGLAKFKRCCLSRKRQKVPSPKQEWLNPQQQQQQNQLESKK